jgi:ribonuclease P protein component
VPLSTAPSLRPTGSSARPKREWRLRKHSDYQRVYAAGRKQFSSLMTYFAAPRTSADTGQGTRIGITAGKVLGKAVERNRIKRRMRAAIVANLDLLHSDLDVVLHPKRAVLHAEWAALGNEVRSIFVKIEESHARAMERKT